ncbi:hypothetical protein NE237_010341 [Protea cynaroides]|uniref:Uncharacterized protein n=1 Tax=Protea cynaroides TaxID=273540 RepID=A0A9Q0L025_9MAGN|nr:hypothetical protein NE237_010341 [Protea cynaroides]
MESSTVVGCMAVLAVSGSVVLVAFQVHKRLLSDFMRKFEELELAGRANNQPKKSTVRFVEDVVEPASNNKEYQERYSRLMWAKVSEIRETTNEKASNHKNPDQVLIDNMPLNRLALYKGILEYKARVNGIKNRTRIGGITWQRFH